MTMRMEPFNVGISSALNAYVPKRDELRCRARLKDYFPPKGSMENDMSALCVKCPKLMEYLLKEKVMDKENIEDIFKLLLRSEDTATLKMYKKLTQKKTFINWSGIHYSVWLMLDSAVIRGDILKEGDWT